MKTTACRCLPCLWRPSTNWNRPTNGFSPRTGASRSPGLPGFTLRIWTRLRQPEAPQGLREGPVRYLGCGLLGGGLQSWQFRYLLDAGRLRLGLSLPWGGAWNDPETERLSLEAACSFIEACQACLPQSGVLNVVLDAERCAWRLDTPEGDVQQQGEGLYALLDLMQGLDSGLVGMSNVNWMRV
ncbi:MAG: hypothetical protein ACLTTU_07355 [Bilophila wadsworthia]